MGKLQYMQEYKHLKNIQDDNYELSPKKKRNQTELKPTSLLIVKCTQNQLDNFIGNLRRVPILLVHYSQHFISRNYLTLALQQIEKKNLVSVSNAKMPI